ncbi:cyclic lactone autoinducer peptide [Pelotomaculum isophthalicicum JI]|uniref:Cyclic lactone autoinducer peptide n=1 Tax=Pelotomaculum isophthalicicum JI TaxID=947010 RepID=A0A9X4GZI1_9FIRM|nr:cyclic lactone autoinducer peptide [Pelotomaculum isophthalicicum]MDF9408827.1 cyclic lactone autoinducer peptide [Pelotomaculum isophthalicicum JI]
MKRLVCKVFLLTTALLLLLANVASASACIWCSYQPEVPASLRK